METIACAAELLAEDLMALRRHFHRYPEPGLEEHETAARVEEELRRLGLTPRRVGETSVVADIAGKAPGKRVALRADMDALFLEEENETDYASRRPGLMHGCGHDAHMAMLLGAARLLVERRETFCGSVRLLFQPAEEIAAGARMFIEGGALDGVDALFAIHVWADLPSRTFSVEAGPRMASCHRLTIDIKGRGGHAGKPHQTVDALVATAAVVMNLQTVVSRETDPLQPMALSLGTMRSGSLWNIISGEGRIEGTVRAFDKAVGEGAGARIERIARSTAAAFQAEADVVFEELCPVTFNDESLAALGRASVASLYGADRLVAMAPVLVSEDFAFYGLSVPALLAFLGVGAADGSSRPHHHPRFDIDEGALPCGAALYARFALDYLDESR